MSVLRSQFVPRTLLYIFGVLSLVLLLSSLDSIRLYGLSSDAIFLCLFSPLLAFICFWAAAGKTQIFASDK